MNARIITSDQGTKLKLMGDEVRFILTSEDTGGALALAQQRSQPGAGIPLHINTREDEVFQVLEGQVEFQVGEETTVGEAGTVVFAPRNVPHRFRIVGTTPALLQITMIPGGLEKMILEIVELPAPLDPAQVSAICEKHGVKFLASPAH